MPSDPDIGQEPVRLLFVCLGNICRSPTAEAIMQTRVAEAGLSEQIVVDSAGTGRWHVGSPPDERSMAEARRRGVEMTSTARQVHIGDFEYFDLLLAMDEANRTDLDDLALDDDHRSKVRLLRSFDPANAHVDASKLRPGHLDVPDPYYGGPNGFADVFDLVDAACRGLLDQIRSTMARTGRIPR